MLNLIWDAGGTLFDTYPAKAAACRTVLRDLGYDASESWLIGLFRKTTAYGIQTVAETFDLDSGILKARFEAAYDAIEPEIQLPFPYVREVCTFVCESGGWNYLVTHRGRASVEALLAVHGLSGYFADVITADDPYPRKPDPASLLALIARHRLQSETCLVVGDRELDVLAGKRAGIRTCLFTQEKAETKADLVVTGFDQLLVWVKSQLENHCLSNKGELDE